MKAAGLGVRWRTVAPDLRVRRFALDALPAPDSKVRRYRKLALEDFRAGLLTLLVGALAYFATIGCDRRAPPSASQPAGAQDSGVALRNWVLDPPVVEAERGAPALRLVCAAPSATEICCALGLRAQIVGRTRFCDHPPGIEAASSIGALDETNVEVLLSLKPDLLLVSGSSRAITERLERLNLRFESLPDRSLADIFTAITRAGELTGRPETARRLGAGLRAELGEIAARYEDVPPARVLLVLGTLSDPPRPPFVAGPGSFPDDLLRLAGHRNVADVGYAQLSLETIVRAGPDVIIELDAEGTGRPGGDAEAVRAWARLGALRAVARRRVHVLTGGHHFIPGPRVARSFEELCRAVAGRRDD